MKKATLLTLFVMAFGAMDGLAQTETTVPTFECISLYWSPEGGSLEKDVWVKFRESGSTAWSTGLNMKYNPQNPDYDGGDYRGSIVNLTPATAYEIELTLAGTNTKMTYIDTTWAENFPIGKTIYPGSLSEQLTILNSASGTPDGYILYDGQGDTIDVDNNEDACIYVKGNYIIIRNYVLKNGKKYGIFLDDDVHDVVIEECDISAWGEIMSDGFGTQQGAIQSTRYGSYNCGGPQTDITRIVVQRNKIHHPRSDANSWAEGRLTDPDDPDSELEYHPIGPQAVMFLNSRGNHVIRYNEVWSDADHYFNDIIGYGCNQDWTGFPGPDSDIYGNYLANCWDEPIETEGGGRNIRIWGNYMEETFAGIAAAGTRVGPVYAWNNVSGRCYSPPGSEYWEYAMFFKQEYDEDGYKYVFNNTILQPNGEGAGGIQTVENNNGILENMVTRNNILHVRDETARSIGMGSGSINNDFDYDLCNKLHPYEPNGLDGTPIYAAGNGFNREEMTGNYSLDPASPGFDDGVLIPNFRIDFEGAAPDMGASEAGGADFEYGVRAYKCEKTVALTSSAVDGQVNPPAGSYCEGSAIQFTATPDRGYKFENWSGDITGKENPVMIMMDADKDVEASFSALPVLTLTTTTVGKGRVSANANGDYYEGDKIKISAFPAWQEAFLRWEGDLSGSENPVTISIDSSMEIEAVFSGITAVFDLQNNQNQDYGLRCYPNPFSDFVAFEYYLSKSGWVTLKVISVEGREVAMLVSRNQTPGSYRIEWNGSDSYGNEVPDGMYLYQLVVDNDETEYYKLILSR